jgi:hypothetical protein
MTLSPTRLTLNIGDWYVRKQLEELREYVKVMEGLISGELAREEQALAKGAAHLAEEHRADYYADNADYLQLVSDTFTNRLRLSSITLAHSIIESRLIRTVKDLGKDRPLKINDLSGNSPIEKCKKYFSAVLGVALNQSHWEKLKIWSKLRNIIVHSDGHPTKEDEQNLERLLRQYPDDLRIENYQLVASASLILHFISDIENLNNELATSLVAWEASGAP